MLKRQDENNSFSFGNETQADADRAFARKVLSVLTGADKTAQEMGNNKLPTPQKFSPVQVRIHKIALALAGSDNIVTSTIKQGKFDMSKGCFVQTGPDIEANFDAPPELFSLDKNFSSLDEIVAVFERLAPKEEGQVLNLTQHAATQVQADSGVVEPENKAAVQSALTFDELPTAEEIRQRAEFLASLAKSSGHKKAMIGGAPFFMSSLERALLDAGITPIYAFSVRDSIEQPDGNGGIKKVNVFKHMGFVEIKQLTELPHGRG